MLPLPFRKPANFTIKTFIPLENLIKNSVKHNVFNGQLVEAHNTQKRNKSVKYAINRPCIVIISLHLAQSSTDAGHLLNYHTNIPFASDLVSARTKRQFLLKLSVFGKSSETLDDQSKQQF